jgi:hypothetical protein
VSKHIHNKEKQYNKKPGIKKGALTLLEGDEYKIEDPNSVEFLKSLFKPDMMDDNYLTKLAQVLNNSLDKDNLKTVYE